MGLKMRQRTSRAVSARLSLAGVSVTVAAVAIALSCFGANTGHGLSIRRGSETVLDAATDHAGLSAEAMSGTSTTDQAALVAQASADAGAGAGTGGTDYSMLIKRTDLGYYGPATWQQLQWNVIRQYSNHYFTMAWVNSADALSWSDYTFTGSVRSYDDDRFGLTFRVRDSNNRYILYLSGGDYGRGTLRLSKRLSGRERTLASSYLRIARGRWYSYKIVVSGSSIKVYIDNQLKFSVTDSQFPKGSVGFFTNYCTYTDFANPKVVLDASKATALEKKVIDLKTTSLSLNTAVVKKQSEVTSERAEASKVASKAAETKKELGGVEVDVVAVERKHKDLLAVVEKLEKSAAELRASIEKRTGSLKTAAAQLKAAVKAEEDKKADTTKQIEDIKNVLMNKQNEYIAAVRMVGNFASNKAKLEGEVSLEQQKAKERADSLNAQLKAAQTLHDQLVAQANKDKKLQKQAVEKFHETEPHAQKVASETDTVQRQADDVKSNLAQAYQEAEQLRNSLSGFRRQYSSESMNHHHTLEQMGAQASEITSKNSQLSQQIVQLTEQSKEAEDAAKQASADADLRMAQIARDNDKLMQQRGQVRSSVEVVRHTVEDTSHEAGERKARVDRTAEQFKGVMEHHAATTQHISSLEERRTKLVKQVHALTQRLHDLGSSVADSEHDLENMRMMAKKKETAVHEVREKQFERPTKSVVVLESGPAGPGGSGTKVTATTLGGDPAVPPATLNVPGGASPSDRAPPSVQPAETVHSSTDQNGHVGAGELGAAAALASPNPDAAGAVGVSNAPSSLHSVYQVMEDAQRALGPSSAHAKEIAGQLSREERAKLAVRQTFQRLDAGLAAREGNLQQQQQQPQQQQQQQPAPTSQQAAPSSASQGPSAVAGHPERVPLRIRGGRSASGEQPAPAGQQPPPSAQSNAGGVYAQSPGGTVSHTVLQTLDVPASAAHLSTDDQVQAAILNHPVSKVVVSGTAH